MFEVKVTDKGVRASLTKFQTVAVGELLKVITSLSIQLTAYVKDKKLSGQVLNVRTGTLRRSITFRVNSLPDKIEGVVGTNLIYAAIHEYGGQFRTRLGTGKNPPKVGGKPFGTMPERSFLRSSLRENSSNIVRQLNAAIGRATQQ